MDKEYDEREQRKEDMRAKYARPEYTCLECGNKKGYELTTSNYMMCLDCGFQERI
tara:strand:+ start:2623 stop:2787 length:165 start_codon:yes stop_codon:yes gene_type:complete